ncbi:MAG: tyrosine--tRNA ligase, partial [Candidatus Binatia bacterium]
PILNWTRHVLFWHRKERPFVILNQKDGGEKKFATYEELNRAYAAGDVHPADLKAAVAKELIDLLTPIREHFARPEIAAKKEELDKVLANR